VQGMQALGTRIGRDREFDTGGRHMRVPKVRAVVTSLALVGTAALTTAATTAPAQSAATTPPVAVSISAKRVVTMPTTIQPGVTTFKVTSDAKRGSGFQLVMPAAGYTPAEAARDIEKGLEGGNVKALKRFEANVTLHGGVIVGDTAAKMTVVLDPGTYWALDTNTNDPDKFFAFTVEGADTGNVMPTADATIKAVQDTKWAAKPASIPNKGLMTFKNAASQNHFIVMVKLKKGKTYRDFKKWFLDPKGPSGPSPVNFDVGFDSGVVGPGYSQTFKYNLPKGNYVMLCFWPDASMGGMPHAFMGMHRAITLK
jgi:hypothetical protein